MLGFFLKKKGIITVFVTLIMLPVLAVTGILVDVARMRLYDTQALFMADAYAEAVLSDYDQLLKEMYGLFSISQSKSERAKQEKEYADYIKASFNPAIDKEKLSGFMPYANADAKLSFKGASGATLYDNSVLETQISDFMKFRIIETAAEDFGWISAISEMQDLADAMDVIEERDRISTDCSDALDNMVHFFENLDALSNDNYIYYFSFAENAVTNNYVTGAKDVRHNYAKMLLEYYKDLQDIVANEDYITVMNGKEENEKNTKIYQDFEKNNNFSFKAGTEFDAGDDKELEKAFKAAEEAYNKCKEFTNIKSKVEKIFYDRSDTDTAVVELFSEASRPLYNAFNNFDSLKTYAEKAEVSITELKERTKVLRQKLDNLDTTKEDLAEVKAGMEEELKELNEIIAMEGKFQGTYDELERLGTRDCLDHNLKESSAILGRLHDQYTQILEYNLDAVGYEAALEADKTSAKNKSGLSAWAKWTYWDQDGKSVTAGPFYKSLKEACNKNKDKDGNKKDIDDQVKKAAEDKEKELDGQVDETEDGSHRDIPDGIFNELKKSQVDKEVTNFLDFFHGNKISNLFKNFGTHAVDKAYVTSYIFHMFSSRTTGIPKENNNKTEGEPSKNGKSGDGSDKETVYSLTDIPITKEVNYLYGAEIEYVLHGHQKSIDNLNDTRNSVLAIRETMNFMSTYTIREINSTINTIAEAAEAVALASPAAPFAPLIKIAVSGTLRVTVSGIRTAEDWGSLKKNKEVIFYYRNLKAYLKDTSIQNWLGSIGKLVDGNENTSALGKNPASQKDGIKLDYDDYLRVLMFINSTESILGRTSDLITLNVNLAQHKGKANFTTLNFKMDQTITAIESICRVKMDFLIMPEKLASFIERADEGDILKTIDGSYYGYKVYRGY